MSTLHCLRRQDFCLQIHWFKISSANGIGDIIKDINYNGIVDCEQYTVWRMLSGLFLAPRSFIRSETGPTLPVHFPSYVTKSISGEEQGVHCRLLI